MPQEFERNGIASVASVAQRDIQENGFPEELQGKADAVFLDLPQPHRAIPSAARCLRPDGVLCNFSPCIEQVSLTAGLVSCWEGGVGPLSWLHLSPQVQRACETMVQCGCHDLQTVEVLLRDFDVFTERQLATEDEILGGCRTPWAGTPCLLDRVCPFAAGLQPRRQVKRKREQEGDEAKEPTEQGDVQQRDDEDSGPVMTRIVVPRPHGEARGHTGYLTFARLGVKADFSL